MRGVASQTFFSRDVITAPPSGNSKDCIIAHPVGWGRTLCEIFAFLRATVWEEIEVENVAEEIRSKKKYGGQQ